MERYYVRDNELFSLILTLPEEGHICFSNSNDLKASSYKQHCLFSGGVLQKWKGKFSIPRAEIVEILIIFKQRQILLT